MPRSQPSDVDAELASQVQVVERNAQLLIAEVRVARRLAEQSAATLSLVLGLMAQTRETEGGFLLNRLIQDLLICASTPDLAGRIAGCEVAVIDPHMIRAAAALLAGDVAAVLKVALGEAGTAH
ncbi:MAG: hypothetical protein JWQ97_2796 [Phenylobacterium sp.]|nr:hypothetical protein [Phenylobacterium sp.]